MSLQLHLCALDPAMAKAWARHFGSQSNVHIHESDILERKADAILSPANSFGFMDGGIDLAYSHFFGWELQDRLQQLLHQDHAGELPVGGAVVVPTQHNAIPFLLRSDHACSGKYFGNGQCLFGISGRTAVRKCIGADTVVVVAGTGYWRRRHAH